MIQYFKFVNNIADNKRFDCLSDKKGVIFVAKRFLGAFFLAYATLFVAAANPFSANSPIVFIIGGIITFMFFVRAVIICIRFISFRGGSLLLQKEGIVVTNRKGPIEVSSSSIQYLEHSLFGDLVFRRTDGKPVRFPIQLISAEDRKTLLSLYPDMAPSRTRFFLKAYEFGDAVVVAVILAVHIIQFAVQHYYIPTGSMENTLMIDDHLFGEKLTFGPRIPRMLGMKSDVRIQIPFISRDVRKGDIIIFNPPEGEVDKDYIKRCIATEGDSFKLMNGAVYINGVKQNEPYILGSTFLPPNPPYPNRVEGIVPKGMVIALGDHRENSQDSRYFGYVPVRAIKAKAFLLTFNTRQLAQFDFSRFGLIK